MWNLLMGNQTADTSSVSERQSLTTKHSQSCGEKHCEKRCERRGDAHSFADTVVTSRSADEKYDEVIAGMACILGRIQKANDQFSQFRPKQGPFVGEDIPDIDVHDFCKRLRKYFNCSSTCFVASLMYLDEALLRTQKLPIGERIIFDTLTLHRLVLVSLMLSVKYHEDRHFSADYYAQVGGISLKELNALERRFVAAIDWNFHIEHTKFDKYFHELTTHPSICAECYQRSVDTSSQRSRRPSSRRQRCAGSARPKATEVSTPEREESRENQSHSSHHKAPKVHCSQRLFKELIENDHNDRGGKHSEPITADSSPKKRQKSLNTDSTTTITINHHSRGPSVGDKENWAVNLPGQFEELVDLGIDYQPEPEERVRVLQDMDMQLFREYEELSLEDPVWELCV